MFILKLIIGLAMLIGGAELLVKGASKIAAAVGISPLVIGLTVVAFGTSAPELVVSLTSVIQGKSGIGLGNVLGSNIFNILFVLGLASAITPLVVARQLIRLDVPMMILVSLAVFFFSWNGYVEWWEGLILVLTGIGYTAWIIRQSRKESKNIVLPGEEKLAEVSKASPIIHILYIAIGLALLIFGSRFLVESAVFIATLLGVSDLIIGLTIIAVGTSLPEVATSILASIRGERDIAVGNVVGSNIFNIIFILGITATVSKDGIPVPTSALHFDIPVMIAVAIACLPIFFTGRKLDRWEGLVFFAYYVAYTTFLILSSKQSAFLHNFTTAMVWFVFPLTGLTLVMLLFRESKKKKAQV